MLSNCWPLVYFMLSRGATKQCELLHLGTIFTQIKVQSPQWIGKGSPRPTTHDSFDPISRSNSLFLTIIIEFCTSNFYFEVNQSTVSTPEAFCNDYTKKITKRYQSCGSFAIIMCLPTQSC